MDLIQINDPTIIHNTTFDIISILLRILKENLKKKSIRILTSSIWFATISNISRNGI